MQYMASNVHADDTVFMVVEPDFCFYKVDAAARIELMHGRLDSDPCTSYENFADEIQDPLSKARFLEALAEWKSQIVASGSDLVPWPHQGARCSVE